MQNISASHVLCYHFTCYQLHDYQDGMLMRPNTSYVKSLVIAHKHELWSFEVLLKQSVIYNEYIHFAIIKIFGSVPKRCCVFPTPHQ